MPYFIDTNIFLRTLHKENEKIFLECITFLKSIKENQLEAATGSVVLAEVAWTLHSFYKFSKVKIIEGLHGIAGISGLKIIDNYNDLLAIEIFEKFNIKFTDALIASNENIYTRKMTVVSYDRDFNKLPILHKEPGEIKIK